MSNPLLELNSSSVHLLLSVAELGSISQAAIRHGLSQPSASRRVRDLERRLGLSLLDRSTAGASFSSSGLHLVEEMRGVLRASERLLDAASQLGNVDQRLLRLVLTRSILRYDLPGVLRGSFSQTGAQPQQGSMKGGANGFGSDLVLDIQPALAACNAVREGEADLGLVDGPHPPLGLSSRIIRQAPLAVVAHVDHRWSTLQAPLGMKDLTATPLLLPPRGSGTRDVIDDAFSRSELTGPALVAGEMDSDRRLALAVHGPDPAIVRQEAMSGYSNGGPLCEIATSIVLSQPIRLIWKGSEPAWLDGLIGF